MPENKYLALPGLTSVEVPLKKSIQSKRALAGLSFKLGLKYDVVVSGTVQVGLLSNLENQDARLEDTSPVFSLRKEEFRMPFEYSVRRRK